MHKVQEIFGDELDIDWQGFLLRPQPGEKRDLEKFKKYTESWQRPGADEPQCDFRVWQGQEGPPSHSIPPHLVAKAAKDIDGPSFDRLHERLFTAYFTDNLDITDDQVLRGLWCEVELPDEGFEKRDDPKLKKAVMNEHNQAIENGATGVPALQIAGNFGAVIGAQPVETYISWFQRLMERKKIPGTG